MNKSPSFNLGLWRAQRGKVRDIPLAAEVNVTEYRQGYDSVKRGPRRR